MKNSHTTKVVLAGAAFAGLMSGSAARLQAAAAPASSVSIINAGVPAGVTDKAKHDCKGENSCKGQGGCQSGDNGCKGKNSCKGKGGCATESTPTPAPSPKT